MESIATRLGNLQAVYLTGDIAKGRDNDILDLIFIGDIDQNYLINCIQKAEDYIDRKVRYLICTAGDFEKIKNNNNILLIWQK